MISRYSVVLHNTWLEMFGTTACGTENLTTSSTAVGSGRSPQHVKGGELLGTFRNLTIAIEVTKTKLERVMGRGSSSSQK